MKKWYLITVLAVLLAGCNAKTNDGINPTAPGYTGGGFPNPLVLFNGQFAPRVGLNPVATIYLPNYCPTYSYDAGVTIAIGDTFVPPVQGNGNLVFGVSTYSKSGNSYAN